LFGPIIPDWTLVAHPAEAYLGALDWVAVC